MDKKSKAFLVFFFVFACVVISVSFYRFYVLKDYAIKSEVECDPETEACFVSECDPNADTECPENPDERLNYYKLIEKKASALPVCDPNDPNCPPIACQEGEDCREILCDETTQSEDVRCNDPQEYLRNKQEVESADENADGIDENDQRGDVIEGQ